VQPRIIPGSKPTTQSSSITLFILHLLAGGWFRLSAALATAARKLHVEVFYRETIMLPPTATLEVMLEETAKMDALLPRESAATVS
jgi:hypothetical protein